MLVLSQVRHTFLQFGISGHFIGVLPSNMTYSSRALSHKNKCSKVIGSSLMHAHEDRAKNRALIQWLCILKFALTMQHWLLLRSLLSANTGLPIGRFSSTSPAHRPVRGPLKLKALPQNTTHTAQNSQATTTTNCVYSRRCRGRRLQTPSTLQPSKR
jgi:hypothetical protein